MSTVNLKFVYIFKKANKNSYILSRACVFVTFYRFCVITVINQTSKLKYTRYTVNKYLKSSRSILGCESGFSALKSLNFKCILALDNFGSSNASQCAQYMLSNEK